MYQFFKIIYLSPILGIDDPTKSDRIEFIGGIRGIKELRKKS